MIKNKYAIYKRSKHNECVSTQDRVLRLLYGNRAGRMVLGWLIRPEVSKLVGRFMDTGLSRIMINRFIKKNDIDISVCQKNEFDSYNDFFKRKLVPGARAIDMTDEGFVSPCDSRHRTTDFQYKGFRVHGGIPPQGQKACETLQRWKIVAVQTVCR